MQLIKIFNLGKKRPPLPGLDAVFGHIKDYSPIFLILVAKEEKSDVRRA